MEQDQVIYGLHFVFGEFDKTYTATQVTLKWGFSQQFSKRTGHVLIGLRESLIHTEIFQSKSEAVKRKSSTNLGLGGN